MWTGESFSCTFLIFTPTWSDWGINLMDAVTKAFEVADGQLLENSEFWSQVLSLQESNEACCACAPNIFALQAIVT